MDIGEAIKTWRQRRRMTQMVLAEKSGIGYASIARIETGRQDPTVGLLRELATALEIDLVDFFKPVPQRPRAKRPARKRARGRA